MPGDAAPSITTPSKVGRFAQLLAMETPKKTSVLSDKQKHDVKKKMRDNLKQKPDKTGFTDQEMYEITYGDSQKTMFDEVVDRYLLNMKDKDKNPLGAKFYCELRMKWNEFLGKQEKIAVVDKSLVVRASLVQAMRKFNETGCKVAFSDCLRVLTNPNEKERFGVVSYALRLNPKSNAQYTHCIAVVEAIARMGWVGQESFSREYCAIREWINQTLNVAFSKAKGKAKTNSDVWLQQNRSLWPALFRTADVDKIMAAEKLDSVLEELKRCTSTSFGKKLFQKASGDVVGAQFAEFVNGRLEEFWATSNGIAEDAFIEWKSKTSDVWEQSDLSNYLEDCREVEMNYRSVPYKATVSSALQHIELAFWNRALEEAVLANQVPSPFVEDEILPDSKKSRVAGKLADSFIEPLKIIITNLNAEATSLGYDSGEQIRTMLQEREVELTGSHRAYTLILGIFRQLVTGYGRATLQNQVFAILPDDGRADKPEDVLQKLLVLKESKLFKWCDEEATGFVEGVILFVKNIQAGRAPDLKAGSGAKTQEAYGRMKFFSQEANGEGERKVGQEAVLLKMAKMSSLDPKQVEIKSLDELVMHGWCLNEADYQALLKLRDAVVAASSDKVLASCLVSAGKGSKRNIEAVASSSSSGSKQPKAKKHCKEIEASLAMFEGIGF